jgi:hypothetical protein
MSQHKAYLYSINPLDSSDGKWDYGLIKEIFERNNVEQITVSELPYEDRAFVVVPGAGNAGKEKQINKELKKIGRVVLLITGDESARFNVDAIRHKNIKIWIHYPHKKHSRYNKFFIGAPQHLKENLPEYPEKKYDVFFSGQVTHDRRKELAEALNELPNAKINLTSGFAQGYSPKKYYEEMSKAKIAPAPAGFVVVDSFRFFEAIEMLCLPVGDLKTSSNEKFDFFSFVCPEGVPVEKISNWFLLKEILPDILDEYPNNMHRVVSWWIKYKRDLSFKLMSDINE